MHLATMIYTWLRGDLVGVDEFKNRYYHLTKVKRHGREKRWVLYRGQAEASNVPPEWHAWLHHLSDEPLDNNARHDWQQEHVPNLTGPRAAYHPPGSVLRDGERKRGTGDYEPWTP